MIPAYKGRPDPDEQAPVVDEVEEDAPAEEPNEADDE